MALRIAFRTPEQTLVTLITKTAFVAVILGKLFTSLFSFHTFVKKLLVLTSARNSYSSYGRDNSVLIL